MRIVLTGIDFAKLVRGEVVEIKLDCTEQAALKSSAFVLLSDMGFRIMRHHIDEAERLQNEACTSSDSVVSE